MVWSSCIRRIAAHAVLMMGLQLPVAAASDCDAHRVEPRPASAADIPNVDSFLLRVERQGIPDSYVFGTFHSADPRVIGAWAWLRVLLGALRPRLMITERDLLNEEPLGAVASKQGAATRLTEIAATEPELYRVSVDALSGLGLSRTRGDGLSILQAIALLEQMPRPGARKHRQPILDALLQGAARELRIPLLALESRETVENRIAADMTTSQQHELLWIAACNRDLNMRSLEHQTAAFASNDVGALYRAMGSLRAGEDAAQTAFVESLVERRNKSFWLQLESQFEKGDLFVAVGNLHLFSPDGLLERLSNGGSDGSPYRVAPVSSEGLRFTLKTESMADLTNWAREWIREHEGIEVEFSDFDALSVEFRAEETLRALFCPGRRCRIEAVYEPKEPRILLTESMFSRLAAAGYPASSTLVDSLERDADKTAGRDSASAVYPQSILIRELVRHGFAVDETRSVSKQGPARTGRERSIECRRSYQLHRASVAQAHFLREKLSRNRPYVFPLDPECSPESRPASAN